jgi:hypothetical protein
MRGNGNTTCSTHGQLLFLLFLVFFFFFFFLCQHLQAGQDECEEEQVNEVACAIPFTFKNVYNRSNLPKRMSPRVN